jgi:phosphoserine phosphatase
MILYAYTHRPKTLLSIPRTAACGLLYVLRLMEKQTFKENMFHMFTLIPDMEAFVEEYTESHMDHVKQFYKDNQKEDDLVISASPEFLISSFCRRAGIRCCMASPVNMHTGKYEGLNCHGKEKVRRFREAYPDGRIQEFYSDSRSDTPLAEIASHPYLVKGDKLLEWKV